MHAGSRKLVAEQLCTHLETRSAAGRILCGLTALHWGTQAETSSGAPLVPAPIMDRLLQALTAPPSVVTASGVYKRLSFACALPSASL